MEKTIVLALATKNKRFNASLHKLFESYAEILASQGLVATAIKFLELLEPGDFSPELSVLREQISQSVYQEPTQAQTNVLTSPYNQAQPLLQVLETFWLSVTIKFPFLCMTVSRVIDL